ncbi:GAP family protein [Phycicoccus flavus]|uniref:GAP family protein n=1 Tax=Phycicoccus flavus TaxID=2502783 RepID=UPI000FEB82FD|nr:GAP family protein [Phycicoccus flavus]NHA69187.1 hypothetical protein [Phycicoccus flavus]
MHLLLGTLLPLCLAAAVSPMMLSEQLVLLSRADGRRSATAYALGTAAVLVVVVGAVVVLGRTLSLPRAPRISARLDIGLGVAMFVVAAVVWRWRTIRARSHHTDPEQDQRSEHRRAARGVGGPGAAFGFGVFSMATNFTTLALVLAAAKDVAASGWPALGVAVAALVLVAFGCVPAWVPVALQVAAPTSGARVLGTLSQALSAHGRLVVTVLLVAAGVLFVVKGLVHL